MFKTIKRMIGAGKGRQEEIPFNVLELWFETKIKESDLSTDVHNCLVDVETSLQELAISLKKIIKKVLTDIPKEHINSVEDYREDYITKMQSFVRSITPGKRDPDSIIEYAENLHVSLNQIKETTKSSFSVIKKFFPEQAEEIESSIEDLDETKKELNSLIKQDQGLLFVSEAKRMISVLKKKHREVQNIKEKIEVEKSRLTEAEEYKAKLETDSDDLKTTQEYEKYDQLLSKKLKLEKEQEREDDRMKIMFSPLLKIFFEYDKRELGADRALARKYVQDPVSSLKNDSAMWILSLLKSVSEKLPEIEPNEAKRMKMRQSLVAMSDDVVKDYVSKCEIIKMAINQINKQMLFDSTNTRLEDLKYKMNHAQTQIETLNENMRKHEDAISEIKVEKDLLMLEKKLSLLEKIKIT